MIRCGRIDNNGVFLISFPDSSFLLQIRRIRLGSADTVLRRVVVAVNMMDVVRKNGDTLDTAKLSEELGCGCVEISALKGDGIEEHHGEAYHRNKERRPQRLRGRIERGVVNMNDAVQIVGIRPTQDTTVTGIEMFQKTLDQGIPGDNVGILLRGVEKKDVVRGQVLAKPNSIHPHTKFEAQIYVLTAEEGGRAKPFFSGYRPQFYFRTTDITGTVELGAGVEMVNPGDNTKITGELIHPIAMDEGLKLAIREGGRTIASGQVTKIIE